MMCEIILSVDRLAQKLNYEINQLLSIIVPSSGTALKNRV
jgi:hypothetical protein